MAAAGTVMTFTPFVDWGKFLPNPSSNEGIIPHMAADTAARGTWR
jgi:hypothetical protein